MGVAGSTLKPVTYTFGTSSGNGVAVTAGVAVDRTRVGARVTKAGLLVVDGVTEAAGVAVTTMTCGVSVTFGVTTTVGKSVGKARC